MIHDALGLDASFAATLLVGCGCAVQTLSHLFEDLLRNTAMLKPEIDQRYG